MDKSEENIKMCEKAVEIQNSWHPNFGDMFWRGKKYLAISDACVFMKDPYLFRKVDEIWLPNQSQLQNMVNKGDSYKTLAVFWGFIINRITHQKIMDKNYSMEQLWLAFVMKDKYKKVWNGEDWIKGRK